MLHVSLLSLFFNDTATTEIYTLSLHDALPILSESAGSASDPVTESEPRDRSSLPPHRSSRTTRPRAMTLRCLALTRRCSRQARSEEHTSELQSQSNLVCRLLLEKKKHASLRGRSNLVCRLLLEKKKKKDCIEHQVNK